MAKNYLKQGHFFLTLGFSGGASFLICTKVSHRLESSLRLVVWTRPTHGGQEKEGCPGLLSDIPKSGPQPSPTNLASFRNNLPEFFIGYWGASIMRTCRQLG